MRLRPDDGEVRARAARAGPASGRGNGILARSSIEQARETARKVVPHERIDAMLIVIDGAVPGRSFRGEQRLVEGAG
jgi:hypothetical protein